MIHGTVDGCPGFFDKGRWYPSNFTRTIVPEKIRELWFVYDPEGDGYDTYNSEKEAEDAYQKCIARYRDEAYDGWAEEVEEVTWGKVFQTTSLEEVEPDWKNMDPEDYGDFEGEEFAEAFAIERRNQR